MSKISYKSKKSGQIRKNYVSAAALVLFALVLASLATIAVSKPGQNNGTTVYTTNHNRSLVAPAVLTLLSPITGTFDLGLLQHITWSASNYTPSTVAVNVIRQVATNPARYELVRTVAAATKNDGDAVWVPAQSDLGQNLMIEVDCATSAQECHAAQSGSVLAVTDSGKNGNTAAAFRAIETEYNN